MALEAHQSMWKSLVAFAPLLGAAFIVMAWGQGEKEMATSRVVYLVLLPVSLLGFWAASHMTKAVTQTPVSSIAQARPGIFAVRGIARALPGREPLRTPAGTECVWYHYRHSTLHDQHSGLYTSGDSERPFLIADESGQLIVDPDKAEVLGGFTATPAGGIRETLIRDGDSVYVAGQLRLSAGEKLAREHLPTLPVIAAPEGSGVFVIVAEDVDFSAFWYRLLSYADAIVLLVSAGALAWLWRR